VVNTPPKDVVGMPPRDVETYLSTVPEAAREMLQELRRIILSAAPEAAESISYGALAFKHRGRPLVYIGAARKHCGLYAITGSVQEAYRDELKEYETSKGTIRFPIGKPLPAPLIEKLVKARVEENERIQRK
jgi:uncharacterized protein YdhG (YjbR/CyaY superfamily)